MLVTSTSARTVFLVFAVVFVLAFAFQGTRGLWEPDEGYYVGVARNMVETGDWIVPQMNLRPFLEKPPVVYWGGAVCMSILGFNEWAARIPHGIWFFLTSAAVCGLGSSLWNRQTGLLAALIYACTPIPFVAANIVTPDTPLAFWVTFSALAFWRSLHSEGRHRRPIWMIVLGLSVGFALLSKGPATLVFLFPMGVYALVTDRMRQFLVHWATPICLLLLLAIGGSWYAAVAHYVPGAWSYFFDNQIWGRLISGRYNRNPAWYAFAYVYLPIVLFGTLPWSIAWFPPMLQAYREGGARRILATIRGSHVLLFLFLWTVLPLIVFSAASSKLPLYILPLFAPLSLISARSLILWKPEWVVQGWTSKPAFAVGVWCVFLLAARVGVAHWETERDTRLFWRGIQELLPESRYELVAVDKRRYGLSFYAGSGVEQVTSDDTPYPSFYRTESVQHEAHELATSFHHHVFITRPKNHQYVKDCIQKVGATAREVEGPFESKLLICEPAPSEHQVVRLAAMGDTRSGDSGQIQLGSALYHVDESKPLEGIVLLGDNLSFSGEPEYFGPHFLQPYHALLKNGVQFYAVLGNHDVIGGFADFQIHEPLLGMTGKRYYTKVFGDNVVQVFFLDSNTIMGDPGQLKWLIHELQKSVAAWQVVAMHTPIYGGIARRPHADENLRKRLEPIFVDGGVDITLAGHNHVYQRLRPKEGIQHFIAGSGGKIDHGQLLPTDPDLLVGNDLVNVALVMEFGRDNCHFKALDMMEEVVDEGDIGHSSGLQISYGPQPFH